MLVALYAYRTDRHARVKQHLNGLIRNPVTFVESQKISDILAARVARNFDFSDYPILDEQGRLAGMLTSSDIRFAASADALVSSVMMPVSKLVTAAPDVTPGGLERETGAAAAGPLLLPFCGKNAWMRTGENLWNELRS